MTDALIINVFSDLYLSCLVFMAVMTLFSAVSYHSSKNPIVLDQISLAFTSGLVALCFMLTQKGLGGFYVTVMTYISVQASLWFYQKVMVSYLNYPSKVLKYYRYSVFITISGYIVEGLYYSVTGDNLLYHLDFSESNGLYWQGADYQTRPGAYISILLLVNLLFLLKFSYDHLMVMWQQRKQEYLLAVGVVFSFVVVFNDSLVAQMDLKYLFPLTCFMNALEIFRLTVVYQFKAAKEVLKLQGELVEVSKVVEIGNLAGQIVHDVRNPLNVISGNASIITLLMNKETFSKDMVKERAEVIKRACSRVESIVLDYLKLMRKEDEDSLEVLDLKTVVDTAVGLTEPALAQASVRIDQEVISVNISGLENRLVMSFMNLISNSIHAINGSADPWIRIEAREEKDYVTVRFIDSGKGIPEAIAQKLFVKQFTSKSKGVGTGIGLRFVKQALDTFGGEIWLDQKHPNTCFVIRLKLENSHTNQQDIKNRYNSAL